MEKFQKLFLIKISNTFNQWEEKGFVEEEALYRFLHTVKGTAASIGLVEISSVAEEKLQEIDELGERRWFTEEWKAFLQSLATNPVNEKIDETEHEVLEQKLLENERLVLLIEDDITLVNEFKNNLERAGYMVLVAVTGEKALKLFYDHKPDCILLDADLKDGFKILEMISEKSNSYFTPIILVSSDHQKETRIRGYESGATDFIIKPFDFGELKVRLENRIKYKDLVSSAVLIDDLTGAFNRKFFKMELNRYLFELSRTEDVLSLVIIDLDHFKRVNDSYGHATGDVVLKGFAQFIMANKRSSDYLIRYGGEEFVLLLPHTKKNDACIFVNRLLKDFAAVEFHSELEETFSVTFSAGVVEIDHGKRSIEEYLKRADQALYIAKEQGRNQICLYNELPTQTNVTKSIRIALIDDDEVVRELVKDRLGRLSFGSVQVGITAFREGEAFFASDWHKQSGKSLILLDGIMPRMDGLEVLRKLRKDYPENKFFILMLTGRKSEKDIVRALEIGADDYLTKPFSIVELEARVKRLVKRMMM